MSSERKVQFTVLMAVYARDNKSHFFKALESLHQSTLTPNEILIVVDGPIGSELEEVLDTFRGLMPMRLVRLKKNIGLGLALNEGLKVCKTDWVARFDSDDICLPDRFEKQVCHIVQDPTLGILGSWVTEFKGTEGRNSAIRRVPEAGDDILTFAKARSPFNHVTVFFRKSIVDQVGGYRGDFLYEDYSLWVRLLMAGVKAKNIQESLVLVRVGNGMLDRRAGWAYFKTEAKSQIYFYKIGFLNIFELTRNILLRAPVRLLGRNFRSVVYFWIRRTR